MGNLTKAHKPNKGFTLIEVLFVIAIIAILLALATPGIRSTMDKQRVKGACNSVFESFTLARSSAVSLNRDVTVNFQNPGADWCLGLSDASVTGCDCSTSAGAALCTVNGMTRTAGASDFIGSTVSVTGMADNASVVFDSRDATPDVAPVTLSVISNFWACKVELGALGRVRLMKSSINATVVEPSKIGQLQ